MIDVLSASEDDLNARRERIRSCADRLLFTRDRAHWTTIRDRLAIDIRELKRLQLSERQRTHAVPSLPSASR
jgi:hypothetical protein